MSIVDNKQIVAHFIYRDGTIRKIRYPRNPREIHTEEYNHRPFKASIKFYSDGIECPDFIPEETVKFNRWLKLCKEQLT